MCCVSSPVSAAWPAGAVSKRPSLNALSSLWPAGLSPSRDRLVRAMLAATTALAAPAVHFLWGAKRKKGEGMCHRCWTRNPARPVNQALRLMALGAPSGSPALPSSRRSATAESACLMVGAVGRLVGDAGPSHPQALLERSRRPGRSAGALARISGRVFPSEGLAFGLDQEARLAAGRRHRRVQAVPESLRPAVGAFADHLVRSRERALRQVPVLARTSPSSTTWHPARPCPLSGQRAVEAGMGPGRGDI